MDKGEGSDSSSEDKRKRQHVRLSVSIDEEIAQKVRDLGFKERTSDSSIVEVALLQFFKSGGPVLLRAALEKFGIDPHRRKT
jgi:hypothetical protein